MKSTTLMVFLLVVSTAMFGQYGGGIGGSLIQPATGPTYSVPDHPMHASQGNLRPETSLLGNSNVTTAHGERPLSDFPDNTPQKSLGQIAREYRAEHASAERATRVWNQQGQ